MEGETRCSGSRLSDYVTIACICVVTEWKWVSLKKKKKKKKIFFFFRETPTSPWVPFRAKFRPLGRLFRPSRPLAWSLTPSDCPCPHLSSYRTRGHVQSSCVKSPMLHVSETWPLSKNLQRNDRAMIRQICSIKPEDVATVFVLRSSKLLAKLQFEDLDFILRERRLVWTCGAF